ncbi:galactose-3-O-sulfotransferase 2-like [Branchiostoma floridae]|uniref:Galactose-3-O-sulfotransferase 2-like n=1 Tax=Branchiostoma floridae TaxID=7739 RepID=A0A9J7KHY6_BRAFL|nr:galactose-3-O-sulfotransferase 2-like [Branchiostoma floridae]
MAFDLGYPTEGADDMEAAERYIKELEHDFTLVLLLEHLDESLVLLRRLMCWETRDVVCDTVPKNARNYSYKSYIPTAEEMTNLRKWKAVDYLLYDTFNRSLWRKIEAQGPDFKKELDYYRELKKNISWYCHEDLKQRSNHSIVVKASNWSPQFVVDKEYCRGIKTREWILMRDIRQKASWKEERRWGIVLPIENVRSIIKGWPTFKYKIELTNYEKGLQKETKTN